MRRTNVTMQQALFGLPSSSATGSCGARSLLPTLDGLAVEESVNAALRHPWETFDHKVWSPENGASYALDHVYIDDQTSSNYTLPKAKAVDEVCLVTDQGPIEVQMCPLNNATAVALRPQPVSDGFAGRYTAQEPQVFIPRQQHLLLPAPTLALLLPVPPTVATAPAAAAAAMATAGSTSRGQELLLTVGLLAVGVAGALLLLRLIYRLAFGGKRLETGQTIVVTIYDPRSVASTPTPNSNAEERFRDSMSFSTGGDFPHTDDDSSTWSQGRVGDVRAAYTMQPADQLEESGSSSGDEVVAAEEEERPGSYTYLVGDYPNAPRSRLRMPRMPTLRFPAMQLPRLWAKAPAASDARRGSLMVEMATLAPPAVPTTTASDADRERSESNTIASAAGELITTPCKRSFGDALKGAFARRRSSSAGRRRWGRSLSGEGMEGLVVEGTDSKGFGLLRRKSSAAAAWTKAL